MNVRMRVAALVLVALVASLTGQAFAGCDTALLIIDVQNLWVEGEGWLTIEGAHIVDAVATVLESAREAGLPVLFIKDISPSYASAEQLEFPPAISPTGGEPLIEKLESSAFTNTQLHQTLETRGITRLLVCGIASGACVSATVNGARELGYEVVIIADAHSGGSGGKIAAFRNRMWTNWDIPVLLTGEIDFVSFCAAQDP